MSEIETRAWAETVELRQNTDGGHFVRGVVVPYDEDTEIWGGTAVEAFAPGSFKKSIQERGQHIGLNEAHNVTSFPIGRPSKWEETADGLVGTFDLAPTTRGEEALTLLRSGFLSGFSVGFAPVPARDKVTVLADGRRHYYRTEAKMDHVALTHAPAYAGAGILEARTDGPAPFDPDNPVVAPRLARFRALNGYRAVRS